MAFFCVACNDQPARVLVISGQMASAMEKIIGHSFCSIGKLQIILYFKYKQTEWDYGQIFVVHK